MIIQNEINDQSKRSRDIYYKASDLSEKHRLNLQQEIFRNFDQSVYDNIIDSSGMDLAILDLGCASGDTIIDRLSNKNNVKSLLGVDTDINAIRIANDKVEQLNYQADFIVADLNKPVIYRMLDDYLQENKLSGFDIITMSYILLHLPETELFLKSVKKYLNPSGKLLIVDIEDNFKMVVPDKNNMFNRAIKLDEISGLSGYRHSGGELFSSLVRSGYNNIKLEKIGPTSIDLSEEEKRVMFDVCFSFTLNNIRREYLLSRDKRLQKHLNWYESVYNEMEKEFMKPETFFHAPLIIYTATM